MQRYVEVLRASTIMSLLTGFVSDFANRRLIVFFLEHRNVTQERKAWVVNLFLLTTRYKMKQKEEHVVSPPWTSTFRPAVFLLSRSGN